MLLELLEQLELAQEGLQSENYNIKSEITIIQDKFSSKKSFHTVHDTSKEINGDRIKEIFKKLLFSYFILLFLLFFYWF
ncbi:hypothetical protein DICPUDRAFT_156789 [Dictyostelium purpureum]|uniref:Uncharacterized protein n=1 Tax=Dictyostelium purpureum TaxID=5786 RepID=F0ZXG2_DICPU|nr:uncharacterized protein DICPUDRAFT_156789 [Dictyostelium purpureum]EGC31357.1 hypothetical protein DICPUDRAFT_156789 [Dictyostelium purpureum]|eukprot:XP_003292105.1 hypothetical protein DICPUDRAFT_156789 [Dictyostelium purpureum]